MALAGAASGREYEMTDVRLVEAHTVRGGVVLIALSRSDPGRAYVLECDDHGEPVCPCEGFTRRQWCDHVAALFREASPEAIPQPTTKRQARREVVLV